MKTETEEREWILAVVATGPPILAAFTSPWISLPLELIVLLILAVYYWRRSRSGVGWKLSLVGAAIVMGSMVYLWMRGHR